MDSLWRVGLAQEKGRGPGRDYVGMKRFGGIAFAAISISLSAPTIALATDWKQMLLDGYSLVRRTQVSGEFNGCEYGRRIPLQDGHVFVCRSYAYHYAYSPEVLILRSGGSLIVIIGDERYEGDIS